MFSQMTRMLDILQDYLGYRGTCTCIMYDCMYDCFWFYTCTCTCTLIFTQNKQMAIDFDSVPLIIKISIITQPKYSAKNPCICIHCSLCRMYACKILYILLYCTFSFPTLFLPLSLLGYSYERLDGSVRGEERFLAVQNFSNDEDTFIFLLSTRAGD